MRHFRAYLAEQNLGEWLFFISAPSDLQESSDSTRYSIEVNYRTTADEVLKNYAKIALGYCSAGIKQYNYHVKHVYTEDPVRILVSSRNWDDGEHVVLVSWNKEHKCFVISRGFYNKDRQTVSVQHTEKCKGENAADITKQIYNMIHHLKDKPDRHQDVLKPIPLKRGPKS